MFFAAGTGRIGDRVSNYLSSATPVLPAGSTEVHLGTKRSKIDRSRVFRSRCIRKISNAGEGLSHAKIDSPVLALFCTDSYI